MQLGERDFIGLIHDVCKKFFNDQLIIDRFELEFRRQLAQRITPNPQIQSTANKNALYFPLGIKRDKMQYYCMLHYSLKTLHNYYDNQFDIVVTVSSPDFDIWKEDYMGFNLVKDYPNVKFIKSDYFNAEQISKDPVIQKWYDLEKVFELGYDLVFFLDCDTIFYKNVNYLFTKYNNGNVWALHEGYNEQFVKVLNRNGIPSGQVMFPKNIFYSIPNFGQKIIDKQKELIKLAREKLDERNASWFETLSEQYSAQMVLADNGYYPDALHCTDVCFGRHLYEVEYSEDDILLKVSDNIAVIHYFGTMNWLFLPKEYLTENELQHRLSRIKQRNI